ncbi:PrgI family protein [Candidatus Nomurabacteria bacterium]|nr:PrgI family protein [Candidatus Nomurabacteria bacterium]
MQQFVVPQFIDVEDKILGPLTVRQFVIMLIAGGTIFLAFRFGDFQTFVITLCILGPGALIFAFTKINGQPFHYFLLNFVQAFRKPNLRVWRKDYTIEELNYLRKKDADIEIVKVEKKQQPKREHIRDLSLLVNTGGFYSPDDEL